MKRAPVAGEPAIIHSTLETGDVQTFAIDRRNFRPGALARIRQLRHKAMFGLRVVVTCGERHFFIEEESTETMLTSNHIAVLSDEPLTISLETSVLSPRISPAVVGMLADLEQCVAIVLVTDGR